MRIGELHPAEEAFQTMIKQEKRVTKRLRKSVLIEVMVVLEEEVPILLFSLSTLSCYSSHSVVRPGR